MARKKKEEPAEEAPRGRGRPPKSASGNAVAVTVRVAPDVLAELRELAAELAIAQSDILAMGVAAARKEAAKRRGRSR